MSKRALNELVKIGFWRSPSEPSLPYPVVRKAMHSTKFIEKCKQWKIFFDNLHKLPYDEHYTDLFECRSYKGCSQCRLCGKHPNGNMEIDFNGYTFPEGLMHYIIDHGISIDNKFIEMITNTPIPNIFKSVSVPDVPEPEIISIESKNEPVLSESTITQTNEGFLEKCRQWLKLNMYHSSFGGFSIYPGSSNYRNMIECDVCNARFNSIEYKYNNHTFNGKIFHDILNHEHEIDKELKEMIIKSPIPIMVPIGGGFHFDPRTTQQCKKCNNLVV